MQQFHCCSACMDFVFHTIGSVTRKLNIQMELIHNDLLNKFKFLIMLVHHADICTVHAIMFMYLCI